MSLLAGPWLWLAGILGYVVFLFRDMLFGGRIPFFRDHLMVYLPRDASFRAAMREGGIPLWEPLFHGGQPFAANPGRQVFYPPHFLVLIGDLATGYSLFILSHVVMAALGMFLLVRFAGGGYAASTLGAVTLVLCGPYLSTFHLLPSLCAVTWMPWIARYTEGFLRTRRPLEFLIASIALSLLALGGDPVQAPLTGALMVGWCFARQSWDDRRAGFRAGMKDALPVIGIGAAALLLATAQLWPAVDFARDTVRVEPMSFEMVSHWSFPPARVLEFLFPAVFERIASPSYLYPSSGGEAFLVSVHLGFVTCVLALAALGSRKKGFGWLGGAFVMMLLFAAGSHTPLLRLIYDSGLLPSLRYPEKFILPLAFLIILWSALAFERLRDGDKGLYRWIIGVGAVAVLTCVVFLAVRNPLATAAAGQLARGYWVRMLVIGAVAIVLLVFSARSRSHLPAVLLIFLVALVDLGASARRWTPTMPGQLLDPPAVTADLDEDKSNYRIFNTAALEFLDDRTPESQAWFQAIQLLLHRNAMFPLSNGIWGYSSVLEWDTEHTALMPYIEFQRAMYDVRRSGAVEWQRMFSSMSNARYRSAFRSIASARLSGNADALAIRPVDFIRMDDSPRYSFATGIRRATNREEFVRDLSSGLWAKGMTWVDFEPFDPAPGEVTKVEESRQAISLRVRADGRAYLNIAITPHRYWSATIDGSPATLHVTNIGFQGLEIPAGEHSVELRYRNPVISRALTVSLIVLIALVVGTIVMERRARVATDEA